MWGIIGWDGVGPLREIHGTLTAQKYVDEVIHDIAELCSERRSGSSRKFTFMQDNARPHSARLTQQFLVENGVRTLEWPANSPDLNPIENLWADVATRIRAHGSPRTREELREWVFFEWQATPVEKVRALFRSLPRRIEKVIERSGGSDHY
jgi:hypothetical protein